MQYALKHNQAKNVHYVRMATVSRTAQLNADRKERVAVVLCETQIFLQIPEVSFLWTGGASDPVRLEKLSAERHLRHEHKVSGRSRS